jgi:hypothetical protein
VPRNPAEREHNSMFISHIFRRILLFQILEVVPGINQEVVFFALTFSPKH